MGCLQEQLSERQLMQQLVPQKRGSSAATTRPTPAEQLADFFWPRYHILCWKNALFILYFGILGLVSKSLKIF